MTKPKKADQESAKEFWAWEYQRRNEEYQKDYCKWQTQMKELISDFWHKLPGDFIDRLTENGFTLNYDQTMEEIFFKGIETNGVPNTEAINYRISFLKANNEIVEPFKNKHGRLPMDPVIGSEPDQILKSLLDGNFQHTISEDYFRNIPYVETKAIDGAIYIKIDTTLSIEELTAVLKLNYGLLTQNTELRFGAHKQLAKPVTTKTRFKPSPESSAIGLWLWDYSNKNELTVHKTITIFRNQYERDLNRNSFGKQFQDDRNFYQAYNNAKAAIESYSCNEK